MWCKVSFPKYAVVHVPRAADQGLSSPYPRALKQGLRRSCLTAGYTTEIWEYKSSTRVIKDLRKELILKQDVGIGVEIEWRAEQGVPLDLLLRPQNAYARVTLEFDTESRLLGVLS
jgi:hypothetical protein